VAGFLAAPIFLSFQTGCRQTRRVSQYSIAKRGEKRAIKMAVLEKIFQKNGRPPVGAAGLFNMVRD